MASKKRVHVQLDLNLSRGGHSPGAVLRLLRLLYDAAQGQQATLASVLASVHQEGLTMSSKLDALTAAVDRANSVSDSAVELIKGLSQQIKDAGTDDTKLKALTDALDENAKELADAVQANTSSAGQGPDGAEVIGSPTTAEPETRPAGQDEGAILPESNPTYPGSIDPDGPDTPVVVTGPNTDEPGDASGVDTESGPGPSADAVANAERTDEERAASRKAGEDAAKARKSS